MSQEIRIIKQTDASYPKQLLQTQNPPKNLYIRGNIEALSAPNILSVVGTRKPSAYGQHCVEYLVVPVINTGVVISSGLAYGIDSLSHRLCVDRKTPTIAVLGSGIDDETIYPSRHISLAKHIIATDGVIISEHPPGTPARPEHFPSRNRIIAGLAKATLVIQAAKRSGSLITARLALEIGREVLAVPGNINDILSSGTNHLIHQGATPILHAADILDVYGIHDTAVQENLNNNFSEGQQKLLNILTENP